MTTMRVGTAAPLLSICAEIYGPEVAQQMADQIARANRIRTPGLVPAGTRLEVPLPRGE
jgi:prophage DNA circulation protein